MFVDGGPDGGTGPFVESWPLCGEDDAEIRRQQKNGRRENLLNVWWDVVLPYHGRFHPMTTGPAWNLFFGRVFIIGLVIRANVVDIIRLEFVSVVG